MQTTLLSFGPTLAREDVPYLVIPEAQEVSGLICDVGHTQQELIQTLPELFGDEHVEFDPDKVNLNAVVKDWNSKVRNCGFSKPCNEGRFSNAFPVERVLGI